MSKTQDWINKHHRGYRNESIGTYTGCPVLEEVLKYEIMELNNLEILKYIYTCFCSCLPESIKKKYIKKFNDYDIFSVLLDLSTGKLSLSNISSIEEDIALFDFLVKIIRDCSFPSYNGPLYCCWLTTSSGCKLHYVGGISCYSLPKRCVAIADLGSRGVLYVSTEIINSSKNMIKLEELK